MKERQHPPVVNEAGEIVKAGVLVMDSRGLVLLIRDPRQPYWGLPKGHVEPGEPVAQRAAVEAEEESGYVVELVRELPDLGFLDDVARRRVRLRLWLARPVKQSGPGEKRHGWFTPEEAMGMVYPNLEQWLRNVSDEGVLK